MKRRRFNLLYLLVGGTVVIVLFAALLVPPFIDWNQYRGWFEREAERVLGQPVTVRGDAEVRLLPFPVVVFNDVDIGDVEGMPMLTMARLSGRLELPSLMSGAINLDQIVLERPILKLTLDDSGRLNWLIGAGLGADRPVDAATIALRSLEIHDGSVAFVDERSGAQFTVGGINTDRVEAVSLMGPWTVEGDLVAEGIPAHFLVTTGALTAGSLSVTTDIEIAASAFRGRLRTGGDVAVGEAGLAYVGEFQHASYTPASASEADPGVIPPVFVQSAGKFELTSFALSLDEVAVEPVSPDAAAINLTGAASVTFGTATHFEALVTTRQIDLDRLLGGGPTAPVSVAAGIDSLTGWATDFDPPPIRGEVTLRVPSILVNTGAVENLVLVANGIENAWAIDRLEATLPGRSSVALRGTLSTADTPSFTGGLAFASDDLASFSSWLGRPRAAGDLRHVAATVPDAVIRPGAAEFRGVELTLNDGRLTGAASWTGGTTDRRGRLDLNVAAETLSIPAAQDFAGLFGGPVALLANNDYGLVIAAGSVTAGDVAVGAVDAALGFENDTLRIERLTVGDLAGAQLQASGTIATLFTDPTGTLDAHLQAASLAGVAEVAAAIAPDLPLTAFLDRTAPVLAPANLAARIDAEPGSEKHLTLQGTLGATTVDATFTTAHRLADWRSSPSTASITLNATETTALVAQLGGNVPDLVTGPAALTVTAEGIIDSGLATAVRGSIAGVDVELAAGADLDANGQPVLSDGTFRVASGDVDPLLRLAGLDLPGIGLGNPANFAGTFSFDQGQLDLAVETGQIVDRSLQGRLTFARDALGLTANGAVTLDVLDLGWLMTADIGTAIKPLAEAAEGTYWSIEPFAPTRLPRLSGAIELTVGRIDVAEGFAIADAAARLAFQPELVSLDVASGTAFGAPTTGSLSIRNASGEVGLTGKLSLAGADLTPLVWLRPDGTPVSDGVWNVALDFEGAGRSPAGFIGSLTGSGMFEIANGTVHGVDVAPFEQAIADADADRLMTNDELGALFARSFDAGALPFDGASGTFTIIGGLLRAPDIATEIDGLAATGAVSLDLNLLTIDSDWRLILDEAEENAGGALPQVSLAFAGPLAAPERSIDVSPFGTYLTIRSLSRQIERMETLAGQPIPALDPVPTAALPAADEPAAAAPPQDPMPPPVAEPPSRFSPIRRPQP